jgi:glycosyltransferase involved in cell wall biosynthesis
VFVTHLGVEPRWKRVEEAEEVRAKLDSYGIRSPYFLHVGRLQARKNLVRLVEAFHRLRAQHEAPHKLVLVGRESWESGEIFAAIRRLGLESEVVHLGYVPGEDLPHLYTGAEAVVFPSLFEGFGIPVIEAMSFGTPVVTSRATSLPEVAGDAALLVDPYSTEEIAEAMRRVIAESGLRETLRQRGMERARQFTWRRTALETKRIYERASRQ